MNCGIFFYEIRPRSQRCSMPPQTKASPNSCTNLSSSSVAKATAEGRVADFDFFFFNLDDFVWSYSSVANCSVTQTPQIWHI